MTRQAPKGTFDVLPYGAKERWLLSSEWGAVESLARSMAALYGYGEIRTPIYESTDLFARGVGETSDIVSKEMFTFMDRGGRSVTLRPEGTSAVMRAFVEHHLAQLSPVHKFFYLGPMFRYERPQSGRYRQHHQFGVEFVGVGEAEADAEVIHLLYRFYRQLDLSAVQVQLNSVGDWESRQLFREALCAYLRPHVLQLSEESRIRFEKNPLRILDSKDATDRQILQGAPSILSFLSPEARSHFERVQSLLRLLEVPYSLNDQIVRGLDYYNRTVFEVTAGQTQSAIGAGGRFDGLIATFGGPSLPAVGFATGLERVLQLLITERGPTSAPPLTIYFIPMGTKALDLCMKLVATCRHEGMSGEIELHAKKLKTALHNGEKRGALFAALVGDEELEQDQLLLKHLPTRTQTAVSIDALILSLKQRLYATM